MLLIKRILKYAALYLVCLAGISGIVFLWITLFAQKTFYLEKKQWHPAEPETQHIAPARLTKVFDYVDTRLPTARSLLMLRNGKTVVEKYYWLGGPKATDYLHSLNLPLLQVLIGIAIDRQVIQGPEQPLSNFFQGHSTKAPINGTASLTLSHLLRTQAPLLWGAGSPDYWDLFYAADRVATGLKIVSRHKTRRQPAANFASACLLSRVIERASGQSVFSFANRHLFGPLGITTYSTDDADLPQDAMVGFMLKALDIAKIGYLLSREGEWEGQRIVSAEWVRWLFDKAPDMDLSVAPGGSWVKTRIRGHTCLLSRGDGGQYLVLVPGLHVVVVKTSTSRFALPQDNGHDRLLQLMLEAVLENATSTDLATAPAPTLPSASTPDTKRLAPNYVFSTPVPQDILDFFHRFALDIISKDTRRIAENYAQAYDHSQDMFASPSRLLLAGSAPHLEYVHITRIRIEKNRAYLRGRLKFAHRTYAGPQGIYPLENLIKLKGRWRWLGLPDKTALLDRDGYFDAELKQTHQNFIDDCSGPLMGRSRLFGDDCFAETFQSAQGGQERFARRLQPFLQRRSDMNLHVSGVQPNGAGYRMQGYISGSALGDLRLPNDLQIVKEDGVWKWQL